MYQDIIEFLLEEHLDRPDKYVDIFHAHMDKASSSYIQTTFCKRHSHIRLLISTIAFGMGIQIPDITYVFHYGPPQSIMDYWQQVGRCARGEQSGEAILYVIPRSASRNIDQSMKDLLHTTTCIRVFVMRHFYVGNTNKQLQVVDKDKCCSICKPINIDE